MRGTKSLKVGITIGDINGIGPEVILKSLKDKRMLGAITPIIYGLESALSYYKKKTGLSDVELVTIKEAVKSRKGKINVINVSAENIEVQEGKESNSSGKVAVRALELAAKDISTGAIDVIVTAPISKIVCQNAGFKFQGHTEYFSSLSNGAEALMLLNSSIMKIALVTTHVALKDVSDGISIEKIINKTKIFDQSLKKDFGFRKPKIAVLSLNPHSGEDGKMGTEEKEIIIPAINKLRDEGIMAFGPFPSDGFFGSEARKDFDGILSMYHDQGLTVFKALSFDEGVNYTSGLPIVRTSPDHGTAFDIAGKGLASETSMRNAIYLAVDVFKSRAFYKESSRNPLEIKKPIKNQKEEVKPRGLKKN